MSNTAPITLEALFKYYKALPHQAAAIQLLEQDLAVNGYAAAMRRDRAWFATWSQAGKQQDLGQALKLIQEFEGCHLEAYRCPAGVWTIGWGNTRMNGRPVRQGDKITSVEADMMLRQEVDSIAAALARTVPYWSQMSGAQQSALVSFAFNLGAGFYGAEGFATISRVLEQRQWAEVPDAMLLYRNPGSTFEAGLRRRREAEGRLWASGLPVQLQQQQEPGRVRPGDPFSTRLTPHIRLGEFALDREERRFHHQHQVETAAELAAFLERVRTAFGGRPVIITSGYRPPAINRSVGGASGSEHLFDAPGVGAVDFFIRGADIQAVERWIDKEWPFSHGYGAAKGFHHVGIRQGRPRVRWDY